MTAARARYLGPERARGMGEGGWKYTINVMAYFLQCMMGH